MSNTIFGKDYDSYTTKEHDNKTSEEMNQEVIEGLKGKPKSKDVEDSEEYLTKTEHSRCVSACRQNYMPIQIEEFNNFVDQRARDIAERKGH